MKNAEMVDCPNCSSAAQRQSFYSCHPDYRKCAQGQVTQTEYSIYFYLEGKA
jgi:hypothetical protein